MCAVAAADSNTHPHTNNIFNKSATNTRAVDLLIIIIIITTTGGYEDGAGRMQ